MIILHFQFWLWFILGGGGGEGTRKERKTTEFFVILYLTALKSSANLKVPGKILPELCGCKFCTIEVDKDLQTFLTSITNSRDKKTDLLKWNFVVNLSGT